MNKNLLASVFFSLLLAVGITNCKEANTDGPQPEPEPEPEPEPAKTYEVGDYYDEGLAKGVVAYVEEGGEHGLVLSLDEGITIWSEEMICLTNYNVLFTMEDGAEWGSSYAIVFNGADAMTLTAQNGSDEIMSYVRQSIPMDIIEGSIIVRSTVAVDILPIL